MKQHEAVIMTLEELGGFATLGQLYQEVPKIQACPWRTKTPFASIRRIVQTRREIYKIKPGLYGLCAKKPQIEGRGILRETPANKSSRAIIESNHAYYQGLLLVVGKLKAYDTFAPQQDKRRMFLGTRIGETRTLNEVPRFCYPHIVRRSQTVDVIWFNDRKMPASFFEIEFSSDIQNSLLKFNDLQDFWARMLIVADGARRNEYATKVNYSAFAAIRKRVQFLDFISLVKQYELLMESKKVEVAL